MNLAPEQKTSPALAVTLNGELLATVSTLGLNVVSVRVHGDVNGPDFASIGANGGLYGEAKESIHMIWIDERQVRPDAEIAVTLLQNACESHAGRTIEELYSKDEIAEEPVKSNEEVFDHLSKKRKIREGFSFHVVPPNGELIIARTAEDDYSFGFSVLWNWMNPDRARVSLHSFTLENLRCGTNGSDHVTFRLAFDEMVRLRIQELRTT